MISQWAGQRGALESSLLGPGLPPMWTFSRASSGTQINSGVLSTASTNVARFETSPAGYLGEPQATNLTHNSSMSGAVPGTPGTTPSLMTGFTNTAGLSTSVVGSGTENGIPYVDIRLFGTSTGNQITFRTDYAGSIACTSGQTFTGSAYYKIVGGTLTNVAGVSVNLQFYNSVGVVTENVGGPTVALTSNALPQNRTVVTGAAANVLSVYVLVRCDLLLNAGAATDVTLRFGQPQLLLSSFAMSDIITTTAAATRAADNLTLDLTQLPGLQTAGGYSCALEFSLLSNSQSQVVFGMSGSGGFSNTWYFTENGSGGLVLTTIVATVSQGSGPATLRAVGLTNRLALTVTPTGITFNLNGAGDVTVTNAGMPTMTTMAVLRAPWATGNNEAGHATLVTLVPGPQSAAWRAARSY